MVFEKKIDYVGGLYLLRLNCIHLCNGYHNLQYKIEFRGWSLFIQFNEWPLLIFQLLPEEINNNNKKTAALLGDLQIISIGMIK